MDEKFYPLFGEPLPNLRPKTRPLEIEIIRHYLYLRQGALKHYKRMPNTANTAALDELRQAVIDNWPTENAKFKHEDFKYSVQKRINDLIHRFGVARKRMRCLSDPDLKTEQQMEFSQFFCDIENLNEEAENLVEVKVEESADEDQENSDGLDTVYETFSKEEDFSADFVAHEDEEVSTGNTPNMTEDPTYSTENIYIKEETVENQETITSSARLVSTV